MMEFVALSTKTVRYQPPGYRLLENPKGPPLRRWLIRKMWQWLHNCGALEQYCDHVDIYSFGPQEERDIVDSIHVQILELLDAGSKIEDCAIICGAEKFARITGAITDRHMVLRFHEDHDYWRSDGYRASLRDMPIHVVPRMAGIAIVPKVAIER